MKYTFIYTTDTHIRNDSPGRRKDTNYFDTVSSKLRFIIDYAISIDADAVLHAGDFGDNPTWYKDVGNFCEISDIFSDLEKAGIPFHITVGQHDVPNHSIPRWRQSALGLLAHTNSNFNVLTGGKEAYDRDGKLQIRGFAFGEKETKDFLEGKYDWWHPDKEKPFRIALVHASVGKDESFGWQGISNQNIKGCDLALFGDIHEGFAPYEFPSGAIAYSVGSPVRQHLNDKDRVPKFAVIRVDKDTHEIEIEEVIIPHSRIENVMDLTPKVDAEVQKFDTAKGFKAEIERARQMENESVEDLVRRVGKAAEYGDTIINKVIGGLIK